MTRVSLVRPKVVRSVHYCPTTKKVMERKYTDLTSFEAFPTTAIYPTKVITTYNNSFTNIWHHAKICVFIVQSLNGWLTRVSTCGINSHALRCFGEHFRKATTEAYRRPKDSINRVGH